MKVMPFFSTLQQNSRTATGQAGGVSFQDMLSAGDQPPTSDRARSFLESGLFGKGPSGRNGQGRASSAGGMTSGDDAAADAKPAARENGATPQGKMAGRGPQNGAGGRPISRTPQSDGARQSALSAAAQAPMATIRSPSQQATQAAPTATARRSARKRKGNSPAAGITLRLDEDHTMAGIAIVTTDPEAIATDAARTRLTEILNEYGFGLRRLTINGRQQPPQPIFEEDDGHGA